MNVKNELTKKAGTNGFPYKTAYKYLSGDAIAAREILRGRIISSCFVVFCNVANEPIFGKKRDWFMCLDLSVSGLTYTQIYTQMRVDFFSDSYYNKCNGIFQHGREIMINEEIVTIKAKILETVMPKRIYLFGSYAKDTYNEESDYDFYVVVADDAGDQIELSQKAYTSLRGIRKHPVDIVVGYESSFAKRVERNIRKDSKRRRDIIVCFE